MVLYYQSSESDVDINPDFQCVATFIVEPRCCIMNCVAGPFYRKEITHSGKTKAISVVTAETSTHQGAK